MHKVSDRINFGDEIRLSVVERRDGEDFVFDHIGQLQGFQRQIQGGTQANTLELCRDRGFQFDTRLFEEPSD